MKKLVVLPGNVVVTNFGAYQHWSLVSDKVCSVGKPMLISATRRTGTVMEEPWDSVTQNKVTYVVDISTGRPAKDVLRDARSQIGRWAYSVSVSNCEHFVKWASGLEVSSSQVKAGVGGAVAGAALVAGLSENPKLIKFLGGALLIGGLAIFAKRASERGEL